MGQFNGFFVDHLIVLRYDTIPKHSRYWGRAEEMDMDRQAKKITTEFPGSDVAAEIAATFAAASLVYREDDEMYAAKCLEHARDLWEFALNYQGSYSDHTETGEKYK